MLRASSQQVAALILENNAIKLIDEISHSQFNATAESQSCNTTSVTSDIFDFKLDLVLLHTVLVMLFRLDVLAKALSVIATATWLGGWLSHSGIVSKPLNLSENFFDHLKAPSL